MNNLAKIVSAGVAALSLAACSYLPRVNAERRVEVSDLKAAVECEVVAAAWALGPKVFKKGAWDVKSTLDLTLVESVDADGRINWIIPIDNTLTPSASIARKRTTTAHVEFITLIPEPKRRSYPIERVQSLCGEGFDPANPSGTALGLSSWIQTTFAAIKPALHGGLSYTHIFELTTEAGPRFAFTFVGVPVTGEIGGKFSRIGSHQLVVTVSPHIDSGPTEVIIVSGKAGPPDAAPAGAAGRSRRQQILTNPLGNQMLRQQAPVRLLPGTTLPVR